MLEKIIVGERGRGKTHDIVQYAWWNNCNIIVASDHDKDVIKEIIDKQGEYGSWDEWKNRICSVRDLYIKKHRGKKRKVLPLMILKECCFSC